jgi:hypothetical protein
LKTPLASPVQPIIAFHTKLWLCRLATDDHVSQEEEYCPPIPSCVDYRSAWQRKRRNRLQCLLLLLFYEQVSSHSATNSVKNVTATILKSDGPAAYREVDWSMIAMKSRVQGIMIPSATQLEVPGTHLILLMHFGMDAVHAKIRNDHFRLLFRYQMAARKGLPLEGASVCGRQPASTSQSFALV